MAPLRTAALAVDTKVYEGMITSSPSRRSHSSAAISSAAGAGGGQQYSPRAEAILHQFLGAPGEWAVTAGMAAGNGLTDVDQLGPDDARFIKWNVQRHGAGLAGSEEVG